MRQQGFRHWGSPLPTLPIPNHLQPYPPLWLVQLPCKMSYHNIAYVVIDVNTISDGLCRISGYYQRYFRKFTSCMTFGAHKLVHSMPFLDYPCELWQLLPALYSDVRKKLYRCTSSHTISSSSFPFCSHPSSSLSSHLPSAFSPIVSPAPLPSSFLCPPLPTRCGLEVCALMSELLLVFVLCAPNSLFYKHFSLLLYITPHDLSSSI